MTLPEQPHRLPDDPDLELRIIDGYMLIKCGKESMLISLFNAWRLAGGLMLLLGLPIPKKPRIRMT